MNMLQPLNPEAMVFCSEEKDAGNSEAVSWVWSSGHHGVCALPCGSIEVFSSEESILADGKTMFRGAMQTQLHGL